MASGSGIGTEETLAGASGSGSGTDATIATSSGGSAPVGAGAAALPEISRSTYIVKGELARGGMGKILVAEDTRLGRDVALKELLVSDGTLVARFAREVRTTARLQHPGIVAVYEAGRWPDGEPFYAMRLVKGRSLEKVVDTRPELDDRLRLVPNLVHLAEAMAYAHDRGVIHRDLKPANVLVGDYGETVVIDWGLAKVLGEDDEPMPAEPVDAAADTGSALPAVAGGGGALTQFGSIVGTPAYMPPEQARGERVDMRADVYALGALVYHVLAGRPPFAGNTAEQVLANVLMRELKPLAEVAPAAPPELVTIVERAMQVDPDLRYQSARELADDLVNFQSGKLVGSHHYTTWQLLRRWVRRYRAFVVAALALLVGGGIIAAVAVRQVLAERDTARLANLAALEEQGRRELVAGHPRRAATFLVEAYRGGRRDEPARTMLGEAMRAVDGNVLTSVFGAPVRAVAWVRDERAILALTDAGDIFLIDPATGTRTAIPPPKDSRVIRPAHWTVSRDGNWLAIADERLLRLVDLEHQRARDIVEIWNFGEIEALAVGPGGKSIAVRADSGARVIDVAHPEATQQLGDVLDVGYGADGQLVVVGTSAGATVVTEGAQHRQIAPGALPFAGVCDAAGDREQDQAAFLAAGKGVAQSFVLEGLRDVACGGPRALAVRELGHQTANLGAPFAVLDGATMVDLGVGGEHAIVQGEDDPAADVRYTSYGLDTAGKTAAAGTANGELVLWELATHTPVAQIDAHVGEIASLAVDRAGARVVTGGEDGSVRVWSVGAWAAAPALPAPAHTATSADGKLVAHAERELVMLGGVELAGHQEIVTWVGMSASGGIVAAAARDQRVIAWDAKSHATLNNWPLASAISTGAVASDGTIAIGDVDGTTTVLRPGRAEPVARVPGHAVAVRAVAWSPDDQLLASAAGGTVRIFDRGGGLVRVIETEDTIAGLAWLDDGEQLAVAGLRSMQIWAAHGGELLALPAPYADRVLVDPPVPPPNRGRAIVRFDPSGGAMLRWTLARADGDADALGARIAAVVPWRVGEGAALVPTAAPVEHAASLGGTHTTFAFPSITVEAQPMRPQIALASAGGDPIAAAAELLARGGHRDEARAKLGAATTIPDDPTLAYTLAWVRHWLGDDAAAFAALARAGAAWRDDATRAALRGELRAFAAWASAPPDRALAALGDTFAERIALAEAYAEIGRGDLASAALAGAKATDATERMRLELVYIRVAADGADPVATADHVVRALEAANLSMQDVRADQRTRLPTDCSSPPNLPDAPLDTASGLAATIEYEAVRRASEAYLGMQVGDYRYAVAVGRIYDALATNFHADVDDCRAALATDEADMRFDIMNRKKVFEASIAHHGPALASCLARALDADPAASPGLDARLTLSVRGAVDTIDVAVTPQTKLDDASARDLMNCARGALAHYGFPRANDIGRAIINYRVDLVAKTPPGPR